MHSCIYEGRVSHCRFRPIARRFQYPMFLMYVDLAEMEGHFGRRGLWSTKWPAVARFRRADHLGPRSQPLDESVRVLVESRLGWRPSGPIRLLTHFRYFGLAMNPVSLFYCFDAAGQRVEAVVAEVNNTPWNEQHCYVLDLCDAERGHDLRIEHDKDFHVSPFLPMSLKYRWRLSAPGESLAVGIECHEAAGKVFAANLSLRRTAISRLRLASLLIRYPAMTAQVLAAIYWQALLIWWQGIPFIPHPRAEALRTTPRRSNQTLRAPSIAVASRRETTR